VSNVPTVPDLAEPGVSEPTSDMPHPPPAPGPHDAGPPGLSPPSDGPEGSAAGVRGLRAYRGDLDAGVGNGGGSGGGDHFAGDGLSPGTASRPVVVGAAG